MQAHPVLLPVELAGGVVTRVAQAEADAPHGELIPGIDVQAPFGIAVEIGGNEKFAGDECAAGVDEKVVAVLRLCTPMASGVGRKECRQGLLTFDVRGIVGPVNRIGQAEYFGCELMSHTWPGRRLVPGDVHAVAAGPIRLVAGPVAWLRRSRSGRCPFRF